MSGSPTIGVFDSGFGGLTVLKALLEIVPQANYLYFGDTARVPYGSKSVETVARYACEAARFLEQQGAELLVVACNTATGAEAARLLDAVREPSLKLNWDPGNAAARGETAFPDGYAKLPKDRIGHVHCKDVVFTADHKSEWAPMGSGTIDWAGQFRALQRDGYRGALSLETHWRLKGGTPEESTRQSMAGMKRLLANIS